MRHQFHLPEEDQDFLQALGLEWETIISSGNWVLIYKYPVPEGYNLKEVSIALRLDNGYPTSQIDMVYFNPPLSRTDNKPIGALANMSIDNKHWQRWSRHRTAQNPWRPELDGIGTHLSLVEYWLIREFKLR